MLKQNFSNKVWYRPVKCQPKITEFPAGIYSCTTISKPLAIQKLQEALGGRVIS